MELARSVFTHYLQYSKFSRLEIEHNPTVLGIAQTQKTIVLLQNLQHKEKRN